MLRNKIYCCLTQKCAQMTACVFVFLSAILWFIFLLTARPDMLHPFKYVCVKYFYLFSMHNTHNNSFRHTMKTITVDKVCTSDCYFYFHYVGRLIYTLHWTRLKYLHIDFIWLIVIMFSLSLPPSRSLCLLYSECINIIIFPF